MKLKQLTKESVAGKTVLYRAPYDIGFNIVNGQLIIKDATRIEVTLPTLNFLLEQNCKIVILTWIKRPEGIDPTLSTKPLANKLSELLNGKEVNFIDDCIGEKVAAEIDKLNAGDILMLENVRFYNEDYTEDIEFSKKLVNSCDICVFDAFPQSHRAASSITGLLKVMPSVAGFYLNTEVESLSKLKDNPEHPFTLIVGGAKITDKTLAIKNLINQADHVLIGGGPSNIFLKELGISMGKSLLEDNLGSKKDNDKLTPSEIANDLLTNYKDKLVLPTDLVVSESVSDVSTVRVVDLDTTKNLNDNEMSLDIGPKTIEVFTKIILNSKTVFWNGPMGAYDLNPQFEIGTKNIANAVVKCSGTTIISGGDSIDALNKNFEKIEIVQNITHISVAGGATLEFLAGLSLPAIELLKE